MYEQGASLEYEVRMYIVHVHMYLMTSLVDGSLQDAAPRSAKTERGQSSKCIISDKKCIILHPKCNIFMMPVYHPYIIDLRLDFVPNQIHTAY